MDRCKLGVVIIKLLIMEKISTDLAPAAIGPYSQAILVNGFIFCSGQIPLLPNGTMSGGDVSAQTEQVIKNLEQVLIASGSVLSKVVKTTVYLADMEDFAAMNAVYEKYFSHKPARAAVQAARLPKDVGVEIECIAIA